MSLPVGGGGRGAGGGGQARGCEAAVVYRDTQRGHGSRGTEELIVADTEGTGVGQQGRGSGDRRRATDLGQEEPEPLGQAHGQRLGGQRLDDGQSTHDGGTGRREETNPTRELEQRLGEEKGRREPGGRLLRVGPGDQEGVEDRRFEEENPLGLGQAQEAWQGISKVDHGLEGGIGGGAEEGDYLDS